MWSLPWRCRDYSPIGRKSGRSGSCVRVFVCVSERESVSSFRFRRRPELRDRTCVLNSSSACWSPQRVPFLFCTQAQRYLAKA